MDRVTQTLDRLRADQRDGALAAVCDELGIDLLVLFGSTVSDPAAAEDVDVAYLRLRGRPRADHLAIVDALGSRYGDALDVMDLDVAGSVARYAALHGVDVLVELTPGRYANAQMAAFGAFCDTQRFRDRVLEALAR